MNKTLLLDFDGVVLKNKLIERQILTRIESFSQRAIKIKNPHLAAKLNRELYVIHGHTVLGLEKFGYPVSLTDFNQTVYNIDYSELYQSHRNEINNDALKLKKIQSFCDWHNISIKIFSNSPYIWCRSILDAMSKDFKSIEIVRNDNCPSLLKPKPTIYDTINKTSKSGIIYFVDDKWINFVPVLEKKNWVNIYYSDVCQQINDNMYLISDLSQLQTVLEKIPNLPFHESCSNLF